MFKSCTTVFSDSIEISDCLPLSSDVEQGPGFITVPDINNNTAMIIKIKTAVIFCTMWIVCVVGITVFCRGKILCIAKRSTRDIVHSDTVYKRHLTRRNEASLEALGTG